MPKQMMKGAEVLGASAIKAGCKCFFGYPITPQNEVPEYLSKEMPKHGGVFIQAESEVAAINMVYGAAAAGLRTMTSSSSPGIALKQEGITYCAGAELPCVIGSVSRGGPGLGGIQPSQSDYNQATRGGGNGDYNVMVYAPNNLQELSDYTQKAFYKADQYRMPVMILIDGSISQMMEAVEIKDIEYPVIEKPWAANGKQGRKPNQVTSIYLDTDVLEAHNNKLHKKYEQIKNNETEYELINMENADIVVVAYGTASRIAKKAIKDLKEKGLNVGMIRPITLWPYPFEAFKTIPASCKGVMSLELNMGQMIDDVKIALEGRYPVGFYGRTGGNIFDTDEVADAIKKYYSEVK